MRSPAPVQDPSTDTCPAAALTVEGVRKRFGGEDPVVALDGLDLAVPTGSVTAVLGPSGCGKTTLLRIVAGTERPDAGRVTIAGTVAVDVGGSGPSRSARRDVWVPPERRRVGLVPQEGALFPHLDVAGNIAFGLRSWSRPERRDRVAELLELVELPGHGGRRPHELSGGERQRIALARALAPRPDVVVMDEPFSALDATLRSGLRDEVADMLRRSGTTAVIVTHDRSEAMAMADEVAVMREGRIVQRGRPDELYLRPADEWVGRFLGDAVLLAGRLVDGRVECALGTLPFSGVPGLCGDGDDNDDDNNGDDDAEVTVFLRPEQITRAGPAVSEERGHRAALVRSVQFLGPDVMVGLVLDDHAVTARWPSSLGEPTVGETVPIEVVGPARVFRTETAARP